MTITITKDKDGPGVFTAERDGLPGTPIVGRGKTWKEALGDLFLQAQRDFDVENVRVQHKDGTPFRFPEPKR